MKEFNLSEFLKSKDKINYIKNRLKSDNIHSSDWETIWTLTEYYNEEFIREFKEYVLWKQVSIKDDLSIPFLLEFQNQVCWYRVSYYNNNIITDKFIQNSYSFLDIEALHFRIDTKNIKLNADTMKILNEMYDLYKLLKNMSKRKDYGLPSLLALYLR